jgi:hypothetical protein
MHLDLSDDEAAALTEALADAKLSDGFWRNQKELRPAKKQPRR